MRESRPSMTAAFVAGCRGISEILPERVRLVEDPYGATFGGPLFEAVARAAKWAPRLAPMAQLPLAPLVPWVAYMQVRTHVLDDVLLRFLDDGGRQVVILGAGFDCRGARLATALAAGGKPAALFEVDHPATQKRKREVLDRAGAHSPARYLAWDFEHDAVSDLGARLGQLGHDPSRPTLTLWEGVTMYLTEEAISATVNAVKSYSAPGSVLAFNYMDRKELDRPGILGRVLAVTVRGVSEPFRFGFRPDVLPGWLAQRGFAVLWDRPVDELAREHLQQPWASMIRGGQKRFAVSERYSVASTH